MARIVFADGSKAMAHNLDDLYERWQSRREEIQQERGADEYISPVDAIDMFVPGLPKLTDRMQADEIRQALLEKINLLDKKIVDIRMEYVGRAVPYTEKWRVDPLTFAKARLQGQIAEIKAFMKTKRSTEGGMSKVERFIKGQQVQALKTNGILDELSTQEQAQLAVLRFELDEDSNDMYRQHIVRILKAGNALKALEQQEQYIQTLQGQRVNMQEKLVAAYERIIELQAGEA